MLFKRFLIAKLIIQFGLRISIAIDLYPNVSKNIHKTQVFIFYDKVKSTDQVADCLGTILSPRFILTTAMCIELDTLKLKNAVITKVLIFWFHTKILNSGSHDIALLSLYIF